MRNVLIRREYRPTTSAPRAATALESLTRDFAACKLDADQLLRRYCTLMYARCGSYEETGRRLGLDRRTVKAKIDPEMLAELQR